jgi:uncharacterized membrane protein
MLPVRLLRCAENRINTLRIPTTVITAPTTSSLRSGERVLHQDGETGSGGGAPRGADFPLLGEALPFADEGVTVLPLAFPPERDAGAGVLRGIRESIAQMVCFSFGVKLLNNTDMYDSPQSV